MEKTIVISESEMDYIHYLYFMQESYKYILKDILTNNRCISGNKELLDYYNEQYTQFFLEYNLATDSIVNNYFKDEEILDFVFDFKKMQLIVNIKEEKRGN